MKLIPLSQQGKNKGKYFAMVDDEDFDRINAFRWNANERHGIWYAIRNKSKDNHCTRMHRMIMNAKENEQVDHIRPNGLDNQKANLRICTPVQNAHNRKKRIDSTSKYKGVYLDKRNNNKWNAEIICKGQKFSLNGFKTQENAAIAYNILAEKYHGEFARLNIII